ncbi:hypothetical protein HK099_002768, partial [Clydaea vesicula]
MLEKTFSLNNVGSSKNGGQLFRSSTSYLNMNLGSYTTSEPSSRNSIYQGRQHPNASIDPSCLNQKPLLSSTSQATFTDKISKVNAFQTRSSTISLYTSHSD